MTEPSAFDPAGFMKLVRRYGHGGALGIRYRNHGADWAELELPYAPALVGVEASGTLASGPIISLMDMAMSLAVWLRQGRFRAQATMDLRVDYLRPAAPGRDLVGRGECYRATRSIGFTRGLAHDGDPDDPVAHVAATFMFTE